MDVRRFPEHLTLLWEAPGNVEEEEVNNFVCGTGWNSVKQIRPGASGALRACLGWGCAESWDQCLTWYSST